MWEIGFDRVILIFKKLITAVFTWCNYNYLSCKSNYLSISSFPWPKIPLACRHTFPPPTLPECETKVKRFPPSKRLGKGGSLLLQSYRKPTGVYRILNFICNPLLTCAGCVLFPGCAVKVTCLSSRHAVYRHDLKTEIPMPYWGLNTCPPLWWLGFGLRARENISPKASTGMSRKASSW